jgi:hypothetical protein
VGTFVDVSFSPYDQLLDHRGDKDMVLPLKGCAIAALA